MYRKDPDVATAWQIKPYLENIDDVRKFLSIPVDPFKADLTRLKVTISRAGDEGMVLLGPGDPLGHVV